jgi:hypothetical protein
MIRARDPRAQRYIHDNRFRSKADVYVFLCAARHWGQRRQPGGEDLGGPVSVSPDSSAGSGRDHFAIEQVLDAFGRATVAIRPNPFMQNFLEQAPLIGHGIA